MKLFVAGFLLSISLCLDLGIVNVAILRTGVERGRLAAFLVGLGSCFGDLIYAMLSSIGIALLLQYLWVKWSLWLGGTVLLLYLTYTMLRQVFHRQQLNLKEGLSSQEPPSAKDFFTGTGLALSSPSAILWFA